MPAALRILVVSLALSSAQNALASGFAAEDKVSIGYDAVIDAASQCAPPAPPQIGYAEAVLVADTEVSASQPAATTIEPLLAEATAPTPATMRAFEPVGARSSAASGLPHIDVFQGGKLLLTNGITTVDGPSGGGIASWATIGGREMGGGIGASGSFTAIELPDFGWRSFGGAIGISDRIELSYTRQNFDTRAAGAALGLGNGFTFNQDVYGAKLRLLGDIVYGPTVLPQFAVGVEYKRNLDGPIVALLGASDDEGIDYTFSATKLFLEHSLLVNATVRLTKANQLGLLGFGSAQDGYQLHFEGSLAYMLSRRAVIGAEYRSKPDNLGLGEDDWMDIFAAYALTDNITLTAAYVDLGSIATFEDQRGGYLQAQVAF